MAVKDRTCNDCGYEWTDVGGEGQCPACGSLSTEIDGNTFTETWWEQIAYLKPTDANRTNLNE